jgi:hypothetical protein
MAGAQEEKIVDTIGQMGKNTSVNKYQSFLSELYTSVN